MLITLHKYETQQITTKLKTMITSLKFVVAFTGSEKLAKNDRLWLLVEGKDVQFTEAMPNKTVEEDTFMPKLQIKANICLY
jgi:hypothetical protein